MPRTVEVSLPTEKTDVLIERLEALDGVVGLSLQRGISLDPPGDILTIQVTNDGTRAVLSTLDELQVTDGGSVLTSEPRSLVSPSYQNRIDVESNETIWDEMAFMLRRETNLSANYLALMALCGGIAAVGLWTNTLHVVIAAMVLAPGFEPLLRVPFGLIAGPRSLVSHGLASALAGYLLIALGAALALLVLRAVDPGAPDLDARSWVRYWSSVKASGVVLSILAAVVGTVTITAQRSTLSAGAMIALALVPATSIAGMALVVGDVQLAGRALARLAVDVASVTLVGAVVLGLKQRLVHRRHVLS